MAVRTRSRNRVVRFPFASMARRGCKTHSSATIVVRKRLIIKPNHIEGVEVLCYKSPLARVRMPSPVTITAVKGFRDVPPDESRRWRDLEDAAERVFSCYGFGEIRLPIVERAELFTRSIGDTTD